MTCVKYFQMTKKIAVVSARQIPRSDSDLMAIFSLDDYYQSLDLTQDRIISTENFDKLDPIQKRRTAQIDDVCSCYKQDIISKYQFGKVNYAEDLDIGTRLVKDGYKIAQLFSLGVIHSHRRPASYYLRRQLVESKILAPLLNYHSFDFKKHGISSSQDIMSHIFSLYNSLNYCIEQLRQEKSTKISQVFEILKKELPKHYSLKEKSSNSDPSLDKIFQQFKKPTKTTQNSFLLDDYQSSLNRFQIFLKRTYPNLSGLENDFYDTLYKLFAVICGDRLGGFALQTKNQKLEDDELDRITTLLERGV